MRRRTVFDPDIVINNMTVESHVQGNVTTEFSMSRGERPLWIRVTFVTDSGPATDEFFLSRAYDKFSLLEISDDEYRITNQRTGHYWTVRKLARAHSG